MALKCFLMKKDAQHTPLESSRCIALPKRHATIGKYAKQTYESHFLLILTSNGDLVISRITIEEGIVSVIGKTSNIWSMKGREK